MNTQDIEIVRKSLAMTEWNAAAVIRNYVMDLPIGFLEQVTKIQKLNDTRWKIINRNPTAGEPKQPILVARHAIDRRYPPLPECGQNHCRWCGYGFPFKTRQEFCAAPERRNCYRRFCIASRPDEARQCVLHRDKGLCSTCGVICNYWHVDHIKPLWEAPEMMTIRQRDEYWGLDNLQTLCIPCHNLKSAEEAGQRKQIRSCGRGKTNRQSGSLLV